MEKGDVITLEDNERFLILMDTDLSGKKFYYTVKVDDEENPTSEYEFFERIIEDDETYVDIVQEDEIRHLLTEVFSADLVEFADDIEDGKVEI